MFVHEFDGWVRLHGDRLLRVLVAQYGVDVGSDICADALGYAWEHWSRVREMSNPAGYLYRVAKSASRRHLRWRRAVNMPAESVAGDHDAAMRLEEVLGALSRLQRGCVVLVHVCGWSYDDTAEALGITSNAVRNHVHRGLNRLRSTLEVPHD